jgi:hypothetical protein
MVQLLILSHWSLNFNTWVFEGMQSNCSRVVLYFNIILITFVIWIFILLIYPARSILIEMLFVFHYYYILLTPYIMLLNYHAITVYVFDFVLFFLMHIWNSRKCILKLKTERQDFYCWQLMTKGPIIVLLCIIDRTKLYMGLDIEAYFRLQLSMRILWKKIEKWVRISVIEEVREEQDKQKKWWEREERYT